MNKFYHGCSSLVLLLLVLSSTLTSTQAAVGDITTIAGDGVAGFNSGYALGSDAGDEQKTRLNQPSYVTMDNNGRIYIADTPNHRIRRSYTYGKYISNTTTFLSTVAGFYTQNADGQWSAVTSGFSGDGGEATQAKLNTPVGVAIDAQGNTYIADSNNHRIRKVNTFHIITTVAGTGAPGNAGDGKTAVDAQLNFPSGIATDNIGNLYIADTGNHVIRKVDTAGIITTIAGTGQAGFSGDGGQATKAQLNHPKRVTVSSTGIIYIVDKDNHRIRQIDSNGVITTIVGNNKGYSGDNGAATQAQLNSPSDVKIDGRGNLFIADTDNHRIRKVNAATGVITTVAGTSSGYSGDNGPATAAQLNYPDSVAVDINQYGDLYIADTQNHRIRKVEGIAALNNQGGVLVTDNVWIKAMIQDERGEGIYGESPPFEAVWKQGGEAKTAQGDRVIWGYFYASPKRVNWGQEQNPDLFVKIWYDHTGHIDVNFFHVSVPYIDVYSAIREMDDHISYSRSTMGYRYVRHTYKPKEMTSEIEVVGTIDPTSYTITGNPTRYALPMNDLGLGSVIQTVEKGAINGIFKIGGQGTTPAGDEVIWGFIYANPTDVNWGSVDNPDVYVKVWKDHNGMVYVNFFHVSVPDINVYSGKGVFEQQTLLTLSRRYTLHHYVYSLTTCVAANCGVLPHL
ncbi:MAG: NHL repeat-containing protein [Thiotrichaceae bacterium]